MTSQQIPRRPLREVYQSFVDDLARRHQASTTARYRYNIGRFERWLIENRHETLPNSRPGPIRRRRGGLMSRHVVVVSASAGTRTSNS